MASRLSTSARRSGATKASLRASSSLFIFISRFRPRGIIFNSREAGIANARRCYLAWVADA